MQLCWIIYYSLAAVHVLSSSSGASKLYYSFWYYTHIAASWYHGNAGTLPWYQPTATYMCNTRRCNTVSMLLMISENIARNM